VALETIQATQEGFGSVLGPDATVKEVKGFIEKSIQFEDVGMATLSQDINNLTDVDRKGFGDVVDRLETMISNQGDFSGFEQVTSAFESASAADDLGANMANELAKQLHKVAEARTRAEGRGDAKAVAVFTSQIDRLVDVMIAERGLKTGKELLTGIVGNLGFSKARAGGLTEAEFRQRAFRRVQPSEVVEVLSKFQDYSKRFRCVSSL
jgi:hypothetical protein